VCRQPKEREDGVVYRAISRGMHPSNAYVDRIGAEIFNRQAIRSIYTTQVT
jgi:hypothetical protein